MYSGACNLGGNVVADFQLTELTEAFLVKIACKQLGNSYESMMQVVTRVRGLETISQGGIYILE